MNYYLIVDEKDDYIIREHNKESARARLMWYKYNMATVVSEVSFHRQDNSLPIPKIILTLADEGYTDKEMIDILLEESPKILVPRGYEEGGNK